MAGDGADDSWVVHPLHPTRARLRAGGLEVRQEVRRRMRFGPLLSVAVMAWLRQNRSWDGDDDEKIWWSVALTVLGDWPVEELGMLQLVRGGDGRPGLRRGRSSGRVLNDFRAAWRGTRDREPWLDPASTGVIPIVLHYQLVAEDQPALWEEVRAFAQRSLTLLEGRHAYQLARVLGWIPDPVDPCVYCGRADSLTLDHANPLDTGGHPWGANLVSACNRCNTRKGATPLQEWIATLPAVHDPDALTRAASSARGPRPQIMPPS